MLQIGIRISMFLLSWLSIIFLPNKKKVFIKYLPVTLFSTMTLFAEIFFFTTHKWWKVKGGQKNMAHTAFLLAFGPYIVLNLWFFYLSKGKFLIYTLINFVGDLIYSYPILALFRKLKIFNIKVQSKYFFFLIFTNALINFTFQKVIEKIYPQTRYY